MGFVNAVLPESVHIDLKKKAIDEGLTLEEAIIDAVKLYTKVKSK